MRRFVTQISDRMERAGITRAQLAERIQVSPAYISKALKGDVNFTLETMTKMAMATGGKLDIKVVGDHEHKSLTLVRLPDEVPAAAKGDHAFRRGRADCVLRICPFAPDCRAVGCRLMPEDGAERAAAP